MRIQPEIQMYAEDVRRATNAVTPLPDDTPIGAVVTDSREAAAADLFFALPGAHVNGEDFAVDARRAGAYTVGTGKDSTFLVKDTGVALAALAHAYKSRLSDLTVTTAVTGSVGKTTTKEMLRFLLCDRFRTYATPGNLNSDIGLPLSVFGAPADTERMILEIGISHPGEMAPLAKTAAPDIAILTCVGRAHIGNFGDERLLVREKCDIATGLSPCGVWLLPASDQRLPRPPFARTVSADGTPADFMLTSDRKEGTVSFFENGRKAGICPLPFTSQAALSCLAYAVAAARLSGLGMREAEEKIAAMDGSLLRPTRLQSNGPLLIDDAYNASPESVISSLALLSDTDSDGRCVLLGDMLELGDETVGAHEDIGRRLAFYGVKYAFFFGVYAPFYEKGATDGGLPSAHVFVNTDTTAPEKTARKILEICRPTDTLLCKASRGVHLERIVGMLTKKM